MFISPTTTEPTTQATEKEITKDVLNTVDRKVIVVLC